MDRPRDNLTPEEQALQDAFLNPAPYKPMTPEEMTHHIRTMQVRMEMLGASFIAFKADMYSLVDMIREGGCQKYGIHQIPS